MPPFVDLLAGPKFVVRARVVTMDDSWRVLDNGAVYVDGGAIVAVADAEAPAPPGFEAAPVLATRGTLFPGFIELHNHISYNALPDWNVPRRFTNRDQWAGTDEYRRLVSGPMSVLGRYRRSLDETVATYLPALVRYVECKCLVAGTTTTQGVKLFSNSGIQRFYKGLVRNVEQTDDPALPEAAARIPDVTARSLSGFRKVLQRATCCLLHLSEGVDETARRHFLALRPETADPAIAPSLSGIHCAALRREDFASLAARGASMVWSPLSNLLLYGATARIGDARHEGVRIALGPDWSPSGSRNLLGELKVARLASDAAGGVFSDRELVAMATRDAAAVLGWEHALGSIEPGKRADLLVVASERRDPYEALLHAAERDVALVVVNGTPRYGMPSLLRALGTTGEEVTIGRRRRMLALDHAAADPLVGRTTLARARQDLRDALRNLPRLAAELERPRAPRRGGGPAAPAWSLALDEIEETGVAMRPRLPLPGGSAPTGPTVRFGAPSAPLSKILGPVRLDPLTVCDDSGYFERLARQVNLPQFVKDGLERFF
ncbi:MAG: amidohydrolase family protein [Acidobacteria bacterium]|nr:amidohydrolase family protein [Acidobacteriota bacterium]